MIIFWKLISNHDFPMCPKGQKIGAKYFLLILTCNTTLLSGRVETLEQKEKGKIRIK